MSYIKKQFAICYTDVENKFKTECFIDFDSEYDVLDHQNLSYSINNPILINNYAYLNITPRWYLNNRLKKMCCGTMDCNMVIYEKDKK